MKKAIVLLLALLAVGSMVFAIDAPAATYTLSANATGAWVYDLKAGASGFTNSYDLSFKYYLLNDVATTKGGEGVYGQIDVTHLNLITAEETEAGGDDVATWRDSNYDGDTLSVAASIHFGDAWLKIYGGPSADYDNAAYVPLFSEDAGYDPASGLNPALAPDAGIALGYKFGTLGQIVLGAATVHTDIGAAGDATIVNYIATGTEVADADVTYYDPQTGLAVALPLFQYRQYTKVTASFGDPIISVGDYYVGGVDLTLTPVEGVTINAGAWYNPETKYMALTGKAAVAMGDFSFSAAIDAEKLDVADLVWDGAASVAYSMNEKKDSLNFDAYYMKGVHQGDFGLKFVDAEGFVPGLSFTLGGFVSDAMATTAHDPMLVSVAQSASFMLGDLMLKPYEAVRYDLSPAGQLYLNLGLEYSGIANTVIKADYAMGGTADDNNVNLASAITDASKFTLSAKVSL